MMFARVHFDEGAFLCHARVASSLGGTIVLRRDSVDGPVVGACAVPSSGGAQVWTTVACEIPGLTGMHDLHLSFTGGPVALNWLVFLGTGFQPPIVEWRKLQFGSSWTDPLIAGDLSDPDDDRVCNLLEYALLGSPLSPDAPGPRIAPSGDRPAISIWRDTRRADVDLVVQAADSEQGPWTDLADCRGGTPFRPLAAGVEVSEAAQGTTRQVECLDANLLPDPAHPVRFYRILVEHP